MDAERKTISSLLPSLLVDDASGRKIAPDAAAPSLFRSVFPPASTVMRKYAPPSDIFGYVRNDEDIPSPEKMRPEEIEGCLFGLSVYYGGKDDDCAIQSDKPSDARCKATYASYIQQYQNKRGNADSSVSGDGISGEWWQGSYYY